jgi:hypothetical protein
MALIARLRIIEINSSGCCQTFKVLMTAIIEERSIMAIDEIRENAEMISDSELIRYIHKYVCLSLAEAGDPAAESHEILDLIYTECARRGIENLYDISYEHVNRQPQLCKLFIAA